MSCADCIGQIIAAFFVGAIVARFIEWIAERWR